MPVPPLNTFLPSVPSRRRVVWSKAPFSKLAVARVTRDPLFRGAKTEGTSSAFLMQDWNGLLICLLLLTGIRSTLCVRKHPILMHIRTTGWKVDF